MIALDRAGRRRIKAEAKNVETFGGDILLSLPEPLRPTP